MKELGKKFTSILLILVLLLSSAISTNVVFAEEEEDDSTALEWEVVENNKQRAADKLNKVDDLALAQSAESLKEKIRVSIVLDDESTIDAGYAADGINSNKKAISYRDSLKRKQDELAKVISEKVLNGEELDVVWNITLAANIISANVPGDKIPAIRALDGVKDVFAETMYYPADDEVEADEPNMSVASGMTSVANAWAAGYTGAGSKVAIVDTGLDIEHQSFDPGAFAYAISEIEEATGNEIDLLESNEVIGFWNQLNASQRVQADGTDAYLNEKVPYKFNYIDSNFDVIHLNDTQGEHGSHVAGIATANKYIPVKDDTGAVTYKNALEYVMTQGNAPDAQVFVMKVFGKGGGAYDSDYFVAIEDAMILGADSVNLSLGSAAPGFTTSSRYQAFLDSLAGKDVNIVWCNSAGNSYSWAEYTDLGYLYSDGVNFATGGSPGSFTNTFSSASVDNDGFTGAYMLYNDAMVFYTESAGYGNEPMVSIAGTYEYVFVDGPGVDDNDNVGKEGDAFLALGEEIVAGKIAICYRGSSSFFAKANAAAAQGAAAVVIGNNTTGTISMNLTGYEYSVPVVSTTRADANMILAGSEAHETADGVKYYTGTITVGNAIGSTNYNSDYYTMSDFSSWGTPGDLSIKPEITTPGGNIYSVFGRNITSSGYSGGIDQYESMSGTSMASPQTAGIVAVMAQYVRENGLDEAAEKLGISRRALIQSLLMSTSTPLLEEDTDFYYSVMKQGSGLANVDAATNSDIVILMDSTKVNGESRKDISAYAKDGKVKAELGDDPDRTGRYQVSFTLNNITDEEHYFELDGSFFTQDVFPYYTYDDEGKAQVDENGNPIISYYIDKWTAELHPSLTWYVDGERVIKEEIYDFNDDGDGVYNYQDAQAILDYILGLRETIGDADYADLNNDGEITTYDAYLALKLANRVSGIYVPANGSTNITVDISFENDIDDFDDNGTYVEGYLFVTEKDTEEGVIGTEHSIPVLGYYGSWSEPSMIDVGSRLEYDYELENRMPYMHAANGSGVFSNYAQGFLAQHKELGVTYFLGGNPLGSDLDNGEYYPERNAINSANAISSAQLSLVRNAAGLKLEVLDEEGEAVVSAESLGQIGSAYYHVNQATWMNTSTKFSLGYQPNDFQEGDAFEVQLSFAPEYYADKDGAVDWSNIPVAMALPMVVDNTAPEFSSVFGKRVVSEDSNVVVVTISAADNEYIAGMFVYDEDDVLRYYEGAREGKKTSEKDKEDYVIVLDGTKVPDHIYVEVWDYAANFTTIQINLNKEELNEPIGIKLEETSVNSVVGNSFALHATVTPWGTPNQNVLWSSSDEEVATVDENGIVTGLKEGSAVITAKAEADPEKSATCEVSFILVSRDMEAIVWDENGEVYFSKFNTKTLPAYDKLSGNLRLPLASTAYAEDGLLYAATFDSEEWVSTLYTFDEETYEATIIGDSSIGYMDMCAAPSLGGDKLLAVYGQYVVIVDRTTGDYAGAFDFSNYTGGTNLVGIAYEEQYYHATYGNTDWVWIVDETGNLYNAGFLPYNGSYANFTPQSLGQIGNSVDAPYFQSLYYDGTDLYWSRFNQSENDVDIIFVNDIYRDGSIYDLGSFAASVWPVAGMFNDDGKELVPTSSDSGNHADALIDETMVFETEIAPIAHGTYAVKGTLDAVVDTASRTELIDKNEVKTDIDWDDDPTSDFVVVELKADREEATHNGLYAVQFDADKLVFAGEDTNVKIHAVNSGSGLVAFAFADANGVENDEVIAQLYFYRLSTDKTTIKVVEYEAEDQIVEEPEIIEINVKDPTEDWGDVLPEDRPENADDIPEGIWVSAIGDLVYNGQAQTQEFRVYDHKTLLTEGTDYTVKYANNKNAATVDAKKAPTVTVTGKGNYKDKVVKKFNILPEEITEENAVIILKNEALAYNGKAQKATVSSITVDDRKLSSKKDYTVTYETPDSKEDGTYVMKIAGKGNYAGELERTYIITSQLKPISKAKVTGLSAQTFTGEELTPEITVKVGSATLVKDTDFTVSYDNNVNAGTAYVTITGIGEYVGELTKTFKISPVKLTSKNTVVDGVPESVQYCGEFVPEATLTYNNTVLVEDEDYTVKLTGNSKAGKASVTFKGVGNYSGSVKKSFTITKIDLNDLVVSDVAAQPYEKGGNKPNVEVYDKFNGVDLVASKDYTLSYKNNKKLGTATVTVKGKGNYTGSLSKQFEITGQDISKLAATAADKVFTKKAKGFVSKVTVTDVNGKKLTAGTDYDKDVMYTYVNDTKLENGRERKAGTEIYPSDVLPAGTLVKATVTGKGNYTGEISVTYRITVSSVVKAKVKIPSQTYTGKEIQLDKAEMTVKVGSDTLSPEDFVIVSYTNNVNKGKATVTIQGVGNYGGTKTATFKIVQKSFLNAIWSLFQ